MVRTLTIFEIPMSKTLKQDRPLLTVIVPCYNEEEVLQLTHNTILETLGEKQAFSLELIYVDDGSFDQTNHLLEKFCKESTNCKAIYLARNFGHQKAVTAGLNFASGDMVAILDADLQDPPHVVLEMIDRWKEGYKVVYGVRKNRKEGMIKRLCYSFFYRALKVLANIDIPLDSGDFCLIDREVAVIMNAMPERVRFIRGLRAWVGFSQIAVPYERTPRAAGVPKYSFRELVALAFDGVVNFSMAPLTGILVIGFCVSGLTILATLILLLNYIFDVTTFGFPPSEVPGYTSMMLTNLLLGGLNFLMLGIIGLYIGRIYEEVKGRPQYIVSRTLGIVSPSEASKQR